MCNIPLFALVLNLPVCAFAGVLVSSPINTQVNSPFLLSASAYTCSNQFVAAMGYSLDTSTNTTIVASAILSAQVKAPLGTHILHVKAWGGHGAVCVTDAKIEVTATGFIPVDAISTSHLQTMAWKASHDAGTPGTSVGATQTVSAPSLSGSAKSFQTTYTNYGGERYYLSFGDDATAKNFVYDTWVYIASGSKFAVLEMDMNQTMANGQTVIYGFQCNGWSKTWDYTTNSGTPKNYIDHWVHSAQPCDPRTWSRDAWHHVEIRYARDDAGWVTYQSVFLDSKEQPINATVPSAFALGWGPSLLTNFQIDGEGTGAALAYVDNMTIYRW